MSEGRWQVEHIEGDLWALVKRTDAAIVTKPRGSREAIMEQYNRWARNGRCVECGDVLNDEYIEPTKSKILEHQLCFDCLFWTQIVEDGRPRVVIKGRHYYVSDENKPGPSHIRGHSGHRFHIRFNDGSEVETTNLWTQGEIPEHFRDRLPDNAEFRSKGGGGFRGMASRSGLTLHEHGDGQERIDALSGHVNEGGTS